MIIEIRSKNKLLNNLVKSNTCLLEKGSKKSADILEWDNFDQLHLSILD